MKAKTSWSIIGLFIITLVVSMPFYSADVMATSLQISKNSGQAGLPKFLDAQNDVWSVEATIAQAPETSIDPAKVLMKVGANTAPFTSCSQTTFGFTCEYLSPLTDGVAEGEYPFQVVYNFLNQQGLPDSASSGDVIKADGSGPIITLRQIRQNNEGKVLMDFVVNDKTQANTPSVGLKKIEIVDADSGSVLQTINIDQPDIVQWDYITNGDFNGILQADLQGEGVKRIKVRAEDRLGHQSVQNPVAQFESDFVLPVIKDDLNFTSFGEFIGQFVARSDITIDIQENNLADVHATSSQASLQNTAASDCHEREPGLWRCRWDNVDVTPGDSIAVTFVAKDSFGNTAERTVVKSFARDISPPTIAFFGTQQQFDGKSFITRGHQKIVLQVNEVGAGITVDGIRANLQALGRSSSEAPVCDATATPLTCTWETTQGFVSDGVARISLSKFQDNVGNEGELQQAELTIDLSPPLVEDVQAFGAEKDYIQSGDQIKLKLRVNESNGLLMLVNLNGIVLDAATQFPQAATTPAGWLAFTENACQRDDGGQWVCELQTPAIKSGPESGVNLELKVLDTAGNEAQSWPAATRNLQGQNGHFRFDILGLRNEANPNYWEVEPNAVRSLVPFVDLDTTALTPTRMPVQITLHSFNADAKAVEVKLQQCVAGQLPTATSAAPQTAAGQGSTGLAAEQPVPETASIPLASGPEISRSVLYGGVSPDGIANPRLHLVMEFSPFDAKDAFKELMKNSVSSVVPINVTCSLSVFTKVGEVAIQSPELQEVTFPVMFGFSSLGAMDENLKEKIDAIKNDWKFKVVSVTRWLNEVVKWTNYLVSIIKIINSVVILLDLVKHQMTPLQDAVVTSPIAIGGCAKAAGTQYALEKSIEWLQIPVAILSCDPNAKDKNGAYVLSGNYGELQRMTLKVYNVVSGRAALGLPAGNVYENIWTSTIGLCVPGIIFNLEKYRQVRCREMLCYQNEVPAGLATPDSCAKLGSYLGCRFVWGNLVSSAIPLIGAWDAIIGFIKGWLSSPLGLVRAGLAIPCIAVCAGSTSAAAVCHYTAIVVKLGDILDGIASVIYSRPTVTQDPYCSQVGE